MKKTTILATSLGLTISNYVSASPAQQLNNFNIISGESLIKYEHPAIVNLNRFEIQNISGQSIPYLVAIVKNVGDTSANNFTMTADLINQQKALKLVPGLQIKQLYLPSNLSISQGVEQVIPLAPLSQLNITRDSLISIEKQYNSEYYSKLTTDNPNFRDYKYKSNLSSDPKNAKINTLKLQFTYTSIFNDKIIKNEAYTINIKTN